MATGRMLENLVTVLQIDAMALLSLDRKLEELLENFHGLGVDTDINRSEDRKVLGMLPKVMLSIELFMQTSKGIHIITNQTSMKERL